jgi:hypothetical protein
MNGLTSPSVGAGGLAGLAGGDEGLAAAGALVGLAAEEEVAAGGGLPGLDDSAGEAGAAGGLAGVCASAPETRRGSPTSAPAIQIRSIMQQDPTPQGGASYASRDRFTIPIKVTNLSPRPKSRAVARFFAHSG